MGRRAELSGLGDIGRLAGRVDTGEAARPVEDGGPEQETNLADNSHATKAGNCVRTRTLAAHPYLGRPGRIAGTREPVIASTPFIVAYRVADDRTEILAVFHGARIWPDAF